jgi:diacylglycerol kinase
MLRFLKSFFNALRGMQASLQEQRNIKVQLLVAAITIGAGFYFQITEMEWCIILLTIALVLCLEMVNTAIEDLVDLVTTEWKPHAGKIKDMAAGAVLLASGIAVVVGVLIFKKYVVG